MLTRHVTGKHRARNSGVHRMGRKIITRCDLFLCFKLLTQTANLMAGACRIRETAHLRWSVLERPRWCTAQLHSERVLAQPLLLRDALFIPGTAQHLHSSKITSRTHAQLRSRQEPSYGWGKEMWRGFIYNLCRLHHQLCLDCASIRAKAGILPNPTPPRIEPRNLNH